MAKKKKKSYWTRLLKVCRQEWSRNSPERKKCFLNARRKDDSGLYKWECFNCKVWFALSEVQCDHIVPVSNTILETKKEFSESWDRLEVSIDGLQILCKKVCHKKKTNEERSFKNLMGERIKK